MSSPHPATRRADGGDGALTRRAALRLGLLGGLGVALSGCSARQRDAMADVDPRQVRLDRDAPAVPRPRPSDRELRRRAVLGGAVAARQAYLDAAADVPPLVGRAGGTATVAAAVAVHDAHVALLGPVPATPSERLGGAAADDGGPVLPTQAQPAAVLGAGTTTALGAAHTERAVEDADVDLALLHARVAAARAAQATGLLGAGAADLVWASGPVAATVVDALQGLLAQEHRARWSFGVVLAWSSDRTTDAELALEDHARRAEALATVLRDLGASPVGALATYPTDDSGGPVDGPVTATGLALRLEDAVAVAAAALLAAVVVTGQDGWTAATVTALAEAERSRWSWGGVPRPLPGG